MLVTAVTCLPRVAAEPAVIVLDDSRIIHLPFAEWLALEGQSRSGQYDKLERRYNRHPPVFWEKAVEVDPNLVAERTQENVMALAELIAPDLEALVKTLHWYTGIAPIHPSRSVTYFDPRGSEDGGTHPDLEAVISEHGVQRRYGESEKEYATQNDRPSIVLRECDAAPLADTMAFVQQTQELWMGEEYELVSESLGLTSAPGLDWPSQILLLVGAYESLLLPDRRTGLQKSFVQRFSSLVADRFEETEQHAVWLKLAYQIRSDLIHGRPLTKSLNKMPIPPEEFVRALARVGVLALCKMIGYRSTHPVDDESADPLWPLLDAAGQQAENFETLQTLISSPKTPPIGHQWMVRCEPC